MRSTAAAVTPHPDPPPQGRREKRAAARRLLSLLPAGRARFFSLPLGGMAVGCLRLDGAAARPFFSLPLDGGGSGWGWPSPMLPLTRGA